MRTGDAGAQLRAVERRGAAGTRVSFASGVAQGPISFGRKTALPCGARGACVWLSDLHGVMRALTRGRSSCRSTLQHDCGLESDTAFSAQVSNERLDSIEVSTSLCGSDNPGSIPGQDILCFCTGFVCLFVVFFCVVCGVVVVVS